MHDGGLGNYCTSFNWQSAFNLLSWFTDQLWKSACITYFYIISFYERANRPLKPQV
ncbi:hypothetical protein PDE_07460 [Penicillium oxalicum 114-2]|uniref:Uncharacterized protein n=1 Tax=Penicillium oxalicum (strain 114-2 / CGMCC 5302) TaxID=933388 RepID=S7ZP76_PENO1|nr:hypothetical protein PDE_07460 [Penicillium oxalicum 114-2]